MNPTMKAINIQWEKFYEELMKHPVNEWHHYEIQFFKMIHENYGKKVGDQTPILEYMKQHEKENNKKIIKTLKR